MVYNRLSDNGRKVLYSQKKDEGKRVMRFFISAVPFFDANMAVHAYRMMTQDGEKLLGSAEDFRMIGGELLASALEFVKEIGTEPFAGKYDFFVDISKYQLLIGMPLSMNIPPDNLICVVDKDTLNDNAVYAKLGILKRRGYRLAIDGLPQTVSMETAVKFFDFILLNFKTSGFKEDFRMIRPFIFKTRLVITDVPDMENFHKLAGARGVLLSGNFYSQPITKGLNEISPLKINALHLLGQINDEGFDLGAAADTIERDPALSISLLRFINAMNPDRSRKIDSIRNAVAILGQNEVRKWATVAISVSIGEDRPSEITRLSLLRAKFAENLAPAFNIAVKSGSLFIAGLFSLLDVILQMPLRRAIDEVAAHNDIRDALIEHKGIIYEVLSLVFAYERADWYSVSIIMVRNGVNIEDLTKAFLDSLFWYRQLLDAIDKESDAQNG
jgi:EAL and modified HD-GYP domain-containing signal transduction protein